MRTVFVFSFPFAGAGLIFSLFVESPNLSHLFLDVSLLQFPVFSAHLFSSLTRSHPLLSRLHRVFFVSPSATQFFPFLAHLPSGVYFPPTLLSSRLMPNISLLLNCSSPPFFQCLAVRFSLIPLFPIFPLFSPRFTLKIFFFPLFLRPFFPFRSFPLFTDFPSLSNPPFFVGAFSTLPHYTKSCLF